MTRITELILENFTKRVAQANPQLTIIGEFKRQRNKILVQDHYGLLEVQAQSLTRSKPTIECAIDKTSYWINRAIEKHKGRYNYTKSVYVGGKKKLIITCKDHGDFEQTAKDHLEGRGCSKCGSLISGHITRKSFDSFVEKSIERNGDIYDFREIEYPFRRLGKVEVTCKECKTSFETKPCNILSKNRGCSACSNKSVHPESEGFIYQLVYDNEVIPYVGLTTRRLSTRLGAHKETVLKKRNNTKLTEFLTGKDMNLLSIKELEKGKAHELKNKEDYWINLLGTKYPEGLNKGSAGIGLTLKYIRT